MPLDDTLGDLAQQQPQGLPPPQPTPYGIVRAQEHQQQWAMPPISDQLGDIASKTAQVPGIILKGTNDYIGDRMQTVMQGFGRVDDAESVKAATDLATMFFGSGIAGAERGALGVAGGRLYLRDRKIYNDPATAKVLDAKEMDLIDESGNVLGTVAAQRRPGNPLLDVDWTGSSEGAWSTGTSEMLSFMSELQHEFPGIERFRANRVSGTREGVASSGTGGAKEIAIPKHRRIAPGTPRDPPPQRGTVNPLAQARKEQFDARHKFVRNNILDTWEAGAESSLREPPHLAAEPQTPGQRANILPGATAPDPLPRQTPWSQRYRPEMTDEEVEALLRDIMNAQRYP